MTDPVLQNYLLPFMIVTTWLIVFWRQVRSLTPNGLQVKEAESVVKYNRLKRVSGWYWLIFSLFGIMTIIYSAVPELYFLFIPLDQFHHPLINHLGLIILFISLVWILIAQLNIDKEVYKYSRNIYSLGAMELLHYSEKMLLSGMLVLFIGYFTTITNIFGLLLVFVSLGVYVKHFRNA